MLLAGYLHGGLWVSLDGGRVLDFLIIGRSDLRVHLLRVIVGFEFGF